MKRFTAVILLVCLLLGLCACADNGNDNTPGTTQNTSELQNNGRVTYIVKVVDEAGEPIPNVMVQLCKDSCIPAMTDGQGSASFELAEDDYKAAVIVMPEGYTTEAEEFYFADGSLELTITLKAAT